MIHKSTTSSPAHARCPKCGSKWFVRSKRRWWERAIPSWKHLRPYRCQGCGNRYWR